MNREATLENKGCSQVGGCHLQLFISSQSQLRLCSQGESLDSWTAECSDVQERARCFNKL